MSEAARMSDLIVHLDPASWEVVVAGMRQNIQQLRDVIEALNTRLQKGQDGDVQRAIVATDDVLGEREFILTDIQVQLRKQQPSGSAV